MDLKDFWDFLRKHPLGAIIAVLGAAWAIAVQVVDGYHILEFGKQMPPQVLSAIGLAVFFTSTMLSMARFHAALTRADAARRIPPPVPQQLGPALGQNTHALRTGDPYVTDPEMTDRVSYTSNPHPVSFGAILARDVDLLRVFVDFSWQIRRGYWISRNRLFLTAFKNQTRGQRVVVPVITEDTERNTLKWGEAPLDIE